MLTAEQLALRQQGITGSEIAAVAGLSPWSGPLDVWRRKVDPQPFIETTHHMIRGVLFEPPIIKWYSMLTERDVMFPGTIQHSEHPLVIATPDGISYDGNKPHGPHDKVLEVKCPSWRTACHWGEPGTDDIPEYYWPQLTWEMAVTGLQSAHVVAFFGDEPQIYNVTFQQNMFDSLLEIAERFWRDHVVTRTPPPVDGSESARQWLIERYPAPTRAMKQLDDSDVLRWVETLCNERYLKASAERREQEAKHHIMAFIGDAEGIEGEWGRITWRKNKDSTVVNYKALVEELKPDPELIAKHTTTKQGPRVFLPRFVEGEPV